MSTIEIKNKIVNKLNSIEDSSVLETVLKYVENLKDSYNNKNLSTKQLNELDRRRTNYIEGKEKTTNWEEIKKDLQQNYGL